MRSLALLQCQSTCAPIRAEGYAILVPRGVMIVFLQAVIGYFGTEIWLAK